MPKFILLGVTASWPVFVELFGDGPVAAPTTNPHPHNGAIAKKIRNPQQLRFELERIRFDRTDRKVQERRVTVPPDRLE